MIGEIYLLFELVVARGIGSSSYCSPVVIEFLLLYATSCSYFTCHLNVLVAHCCFRARGENAVEVSGVNVTVQTDRQTYKMMNRSLHKVLLKLLKKISCETIKTLINIKHIKNFMRPSFIILFFKNRLDSTPVMMFQDTHFKKVAEKENFWDGKRRRKK